MDLVVIKYGGGLITTKAKLCEANYDHINGLSEVVKRLLLLYDDNDKVHVIIVHGAGSFGHLKAKQNKLHLGHDPSMAKEQKKAIQDVRNDMKTLCSLVGQSLQKLGLNVRYFHPHECGFQGTKYDLIKAAQIQDLLDAFQGGITIIHGDVVQTEGAEQFGILSGDDIAVKLVLEAEKSAKFRKIHMIFAMTGADGVMTLPPDHPESRLISLWHPGDEDIFCSHNADIDVTGGIRLKLDCASIICQETGNKANVWILDGRKPNRIIEAITANATVGTRILLNEITQPRVD